MKLKLEAQFTMDEISLLTMSEIEEYKEIINKIYEGKNK